MSRRAGQERILIIAGSDPSGGAGIEADIKTVTLFGAYAATAITALTVQDTTGVAGIHAVPPAFVKRQIETVLADIGAEAVKIGMLGQKEMVCAVAAVLGDCPPDVPVVLDPVLAATSGAALMEADGLEALKGKLIPRARLVTPNVDEAAALTGLAITSPEEAERAGRALLAMGAKAALVTGGRYGEDTITDLLVEADGATAFEDPLIDSRNTHGTGCTLASGIAVGLARGEGLEDAVRAARAFVRRAIEAAPGYGSGYGPMGHAAADRDNR